MSKTRQKISGPKRPKTVAGKVFYGLEAVVKFDRLGMDRLPNNKQVTG